MSQREGVLDHMEESWKKVGREMLEKSSQFLNSSTIHFQSKTVRKEFSKTLRFVYKLNTLLTKCWKEVKVVGKEKVEENQRKRSRKAEKEEREKERGRVRRERERH